MYVTILLDPGKCEAFMKILIRGWRREDGTQPVPLINIVMSETVAEDLLARNLRPPNT